MPQPIRIFFSCSGVGIIDRGIETFFREAFDGLRGTEGLDITLYKGAGTETDREHVLWNVPRTGRIARLLGACIRRNSYVTEQLSTFPSMVRAIRKHRPDIIFYSDSNLGFELFRWRKQIGVPFRLLFSNGGPCNPPFPRTDYVHQVTPFHFEQALAAGVSPKLQHMVPYGISVPAGGPDVGERARRTVRERLRLPLDRRIVLSVGWIAAEQKRMDYVVNELARLPTPRPYLVLLGSIDKESGMVLDLARAKLGTEDFTARSMPHSQVTDYYRAADIFVLGSLQEGFGRVFLEALVHGLPVIAHDHPVMRFVLGSHGSLADLSKAGALTEQLSFALPIPNTSEAAAERRETVRRRFSWPVLAPQYRDMFTDCAGRVQPSLK
jgi:1,2-diacylglycerol 3-alpha-glucosyltransferase